MRSQEETESFSEQFDSGGESTAGRNSEGRAYRWLGSGRNAEPHPPGTGNSRKLLVILPKGTKERNNVAGPG